MFKEILVPELTKFEEPTINIVRPGYKEKYANLSVTSDILKGLEDFVGKPNKSYMLVTAVSPVEYWGDNKNHDAFTEHWLKKNHGTFCTDGTFFKNHVNQDPTKNYGDNEMSWYDDKMKRVLVLVGVDHAKAPDIVNDLENGKRLSVSMGCRVAHDVCSICGNKAPTRQDYCDHAKYQLGNILPDGRKVFVDNPDPRFFDLSKVIRPAGHIEYIVKVVKPKIVDMKSSAKKDENLQETNGKNLDKAASIGGAQLFEENQDFADKFANLNKLCVINKVVNGEPVTEEEMPEKMQDVIRKSKNIVNLSDPEDIDDKTLEQLSEHSLPEILTSGRALGIDLKIPELAKITIIKITKKDPEMDSFVKDLDEAECPYQDILNKGPINTVLNNPKILKMFEDKGYLTDKEENIKEAALDLFAPYFEKRSNFRPVLEKRAFFNRPEGALRPTVISDASGNQYLSTQEALDRSGDSEVLRNAAKALMGAGALGYSTLVAKRLPFIGGRWLYPAAWLGTGYGLNKLYDYMDRPKLQVQPDVVSQKIGSIVKNSSINHKEKTAQDYTYDMSTPMMSFPNQNTWVDSLSDLTNYAQQNPKMSALAGLLGVGLLGAGASSLNSMFNATGAMAKEVGRRLTGPSMSTRQKLKNFKTLYKK